MAACVSPAVPDFLAEPRTLRFLAGFVRKRVPASSCEDVVQSVLCSALEATPPAAPEALPKWLTGIARHKIADYHRAAARERGETAEERAHWEDPVETRDLVARARAFVGEPERRTFEWMLRVHDGDALEDIAREEALPAPVVRQRVSRLRRALRGALGIAAALALFFALRRGDVERIGPEPGDASIGAAMDPIATVQGRWRVVDVACGRDASAVACLAARAASVDVRGSHATVVLGGLRRTALLRAEHGAVRVMIDPEQGRDVRVDVRGERLEISDELGTITLARE